MEEVIELFFDGPHAMIEQSKDGSKLAIRIMAHLNPHLCDPPYWLVNPNGKHFLMGDDLYQIRVTEGIVGYPERMGIMATAIKVN